MMFFSAHIDHHNNQQQLLLCHQNKHQEKESNNNSNNNNSDNSDNSNNNKMIFSNVSGDVNHNVNHNSNRKKITKLKCSFKAIRLLPSLIFSNQSNQNNVKDMNQTEIEFANNCNHSWDHHNLIANKFVLSKSKKCKSLSSLCLLPTTTTTTISQLNLVCLLLLLILLQLFGQMECSYESHFMNSLAAHHYHHHSSSPYLPSSSSSEPIKAAINTHHTVGYHDLDLPPSSSEPYSPNLIEVKSSVPSFTIKFNSASSKVKVFHEHESAKPPKEPKESFSEDEPQILRHQVMKPVIQEVHEIISPFRKIVQEVKPVTEEINTIVARSNGVSGAGATANALANLAPGLLMTNTPISNSLSPLPISDVHQAGQNMDGGHHIRPLIKDLHAFLASMKQHHKPDLVIMSENELFDNSLYNGANEFDLKYAAHNIDKSSMFDLYQDR